jgi:hypothetical protein
MLLLLAPCPFAARAAEPVAELAPLPTTLEQPSELAAPEFEHATPVSFDDLLLQSSPTTNNVSFFADLLIWNVREGAAENWAQEIALPGPGVPHGSVNLIDAPFEWNAGLRVGASRQVDDDFDVGLCYTNFFTQARNRASGQVYSAFLGNFYVDNANGAVFGPHYESAEIDWDFDFHTIDFEIGRTCKLDPSLTLRPFAGLKSAIIDQTIHSRWQGPINDPPHTYLFKSAVENIQQDFWGIGPSLGVTATAPIVAASQRSLRLIASPSAALMYGNWKFSDHYQNDGPTSTTVPAPTTSTINLSPIHGAATMVRGVVGVEWVQQFARTTATFGVGYEAQVWLNQMQLYTLSAGRLNNLTSLQGGVVELSFTF